jgi:DNA-directed RNA polymerase subunit RPC12/RpoP
MEESIFKLIRRYQYSSEAIIFKGKLESEGIEVFMRDNNTVDTNPLYSNAVGGVKLFVKKEDFVEANNILSQVSEYSLDEENQLIKCPKCGVEQITMITSINDLKSFFSFVFSLLFVLMPFYSKYKYRCNSCKFEFN